MSNTFSEDRNATSPTATTPPEGQWLKLNEACRLLGISEITLRRRVRAGLLPHQFQNGKYYVWVGTNQLLHKAPPAFAPPPAPSTPQHQQISRAGFAAQPTPTLHAGAAQAPAAALAAREYNTLRAKVIELENIVKNQLRTIEDQQTLISFLETEINSRK